MLVFLLKDIYPLLYLFCILVLIQQEHPWVTDGGRILLPPTEDHCSVIEVTEEEVKNSVNIIYKLSSLVSFKHFALTMRLNDELTAHPDHCIKSPKELCPLWLPRR